MTNTTYLEAKRLSLYALKLSSRQSKTQADIDSQKAFLDILKDDIIEKNFMTPPKKKMKTFMTLWNT